MEKKIFHVFFTELSNPRKTHWRKVRGIDEKQALWNAKWIAIFENWTIERVVLQEGVNK
ncbi:MAG: hypothetical protein KBT02_00065 [Treponema sp.]|nr:hypothetical protein [Candidatus Treponema caballi]